MFHTIVVSFASCSILSTSHLGITTSSNTQDSIASSIFIQNFSAFSFASFCILSLLPRIPFFKNSGDILSVSCFILFFVGASAFDTLSSAEDTSFQGSTFFTYFPADCTNGTATGKAPHTVAHNATFLAVVSPVCATSNIACSVHPTNAHCATPFAIVGKLRAAIHAFAV